MTSAYQADGLMEIFEEEREQISNCGERFTQEYEQLRKWHAADWIELEREMRH